MTAFFRTVAFVLPLILCSISEVVIAQVAINPSSIATGSITPGDTAGFPATISAPGSYKLTANITPGSFTTNAIDVTGNDVTLDLNGFSVSSLQTCARMTPGNSCIGSSVTAQVLIKITGSRVVVKNGSVYGSKGDGIQITGDNVTLDSLSISQSAYRGIYLAANGNSPAILNSTITLNGGGGYFGTALGWGGTLVNDTFSYNYSGAEVDQGVVENVIANFNYGYGIQAGQSAVTHVQAIGNGNVGVLGGRVVRDSIADQNALDGFNNDSETTLYINSTAFANSAKGFNLTSASCYSNIQASGNTTGQITGGVQLTGTHVTCP